MSATSTPDLRLDDLEASPPCLPCCRNSHLAYRLGAFQLWECPECGTGRIDPRLRAPVRLERIYNHAQYFRVGLSGKLSVAKRLHKALYRTIVSTYQHADAQVRRREFLTRFVPQGEAVRYLEIGCGTGRLLEVLRRDCPCWDLTGIEPSEVAARHCREQGFRVLTGTVEEAALGDARFDAVCAWNVIEHVDDPRAFLEWIAARLAPGGRLFLHTPNYGGLMRRVYGPRWFEFKPEYHLYYFTFRSLTELAESAGFRRVYPAELRWQHRVGHQIRFVAIRR